MTLHARLRDATQPAHSRLEASLGLLNEPAAVRILHLLGRFHGFHASWEPAVQKVLPDRLSNDRLRLPWLEHDLRSLGVSDAHIRALPACPDAVLLCQDEASAAGSLYVLEGSTLGGRVINRRLSTAPWYPPNGLTYWEADGPSTGGRWKETLEYLERLPAGWSNAIVASACATFALLQSWLVAGSVDQENRR